MRVRLALLTGGPLSAPVVREPTLNGSERMTTLWADVRSGARAMARQPAFTAIAVLTLALGIGANAAIFSVVRSVLLRPLPFPEPDRLVQVWEARRDRGWTRSSFTHANFWDVQDMNRSFSAMGAITWASITLAGKDSPERLDAAYVTAGFFRALGVTPIAGRTLADGEDRAGADTRIAILSHRLWTTQFGADRDIVGRTIALSGGSYRVIGVLPPGTPWLDAGDLFLPLTRGPNENRGSFELSVVGRLAPTATIESARADLDRVARQSGESVRRSEGHGCHHRAVGGVGRE